MIAAQSIEEAVIAKLRDLPADKQQEVLDFASFLGMKAAEPPTVAPLKSLRGLWKDRGISISEEDLDKTRKELWSEFPRERFFDTEAPETASEPK